MHKTLFNLKTKQRDLVPWPPTGSHADMLDYVPSSQHLEFLALIRNGESIDDALIITTENALGLDILQRTRIPQSLRTCP